jgi:hypothetical protein
MTTVFFRQNREKDGQGNGMLSGLRAFFGVQIIRRIFRDLFGALIASSASAFIVSEFGRFLIGKGWQIANVVYQSVGLVGCVAVIVLTKIIPHKVTVLANWLQMVIIYFVCVLIAVIIQYPERFGQYSRRLGIIFWASLTCIALNITIEVFLKKREA